MNSLLQSSSLGSNGLAGVILRSRIYDSGSSSGSIVAPILASRAGYEMTFATDPRGNLFDSEALYGLDAAPFSGSMSETGAGAGGELAPAIFDAEGVPTVSEAAEERHRRVSIPPFESEGENLGEGRPLSDDKGADESMAPKKSRKRIYRPAGPVGWVPDHPLKELEISIAVCSVIMLAVFSLMDEDVSDVLSNI